MKLVKLVKRIIREEVRATLDAMTEDDRRTQSLSIHQKVSECCFRSKSFITALYKI